MTTTTWSELCEALRVLPDTDLPTPTLAARAALFGLKITELQIGWIRDVNAADLATRGRTFVRRWNG